MSDMIRDVHASHDTAESEPEPEEIGLESDSHPPLLENATVTIYFDGLIFMAYNKLKKLYQAAILTEAKGHQLVIEVKSRDEDNRVRVLTRSEWDHAPVKEMAPFWLYVDSGQLLQERDFSADVYEPEEKDEKSFERIFDFDERFKRPMYPKPGMFAAFNFPQGISYSAENANLVLIPEDEPDKRVELPGISTLAALDIDAVSNGGGKKSIVLANKEGKNEFFRFELQPGKHYDIKILNQPIGRPTTLHNVHPGHEHFFQFFDLFDLRREDRKFDIAPAPAAAATATPDSPPCVPTKGSGQSGLGSGSG